MTQEEKQLLLIDLCARLPYGVRLLIERSNKVETLTLIDPGNQEVWLSDAGGFVDIEEIRPYLRPMSSMTDEEKRTYLTLRAHALPFLIVEWLDKNHFDHRMDNDDEHLIEIGLALEAKEGMYKID